MPNPTIDPEALAKLSRLDLTDDEAAKFARQLPKIIDYVSQLQAIEFSPLDVLPPAPMMLRPDKASVSKVIEAILDEAPERQDRYWKVKAVFS